MVPRGARGVPGVARGWPGGGQGVPGGARGCQVRDDGAGDDRGYQGALRISYNL